jgi:L-2,4-diaminobutyric acid acetyltransferase
LSDQSDQEDEHIIFRNPDIKDGKKLWEITKRSEKLDLNSPYYYLIMCTHFAQTSIVAEKKEEIVGFVTAYIPPPSPETIFVWQVAVDNKFRGKGIAGRMLLAVINNAIKLNVKYLDATITPSNLASINLFTSTAKKVGAPFEFEKVYFSEMDLGGGHEPEKLFRIGPINNWVDF